MYWLAITQSMQVVSYPSSYLCGFGFIARITTTRLHRAIGHHIHCCARGLQLQVAIKHVKTHCYSYDFSTWNSLTITIIMVPMAYVILQLVRSSHALLSLL